MTNIYTIGNCGYIMKDRYELRWEGKDEVLDVLNEKISKKLSDCVEESINCRSTKNFFIEGDNLEVLKILQNEYKSKIKMIYIDPPYNTGNRYTYNDNLRGRGNVCGRSNWLNMMYPRIYLARQWLSKDGVIFVSIDENESHSLRFLMNEIFGEKNFVGGGVRKTRSSFSMVKNGYDTQHEYYLIYTKNISLFKIRGQRKDYSKYKNPDNDPRGAWVKRHICAPSYSKSMSYAIENPYTGQVDYPPHGRSWSVTKEKFKKWEDEGRVVFQAKIKKGTRGFFVKRYLSDSKSDYKVFGSLSAWENAYLNARGTSDLENLLGGKYFNYPKPVSFIKKLIESTTSGEDIILDFFAGSGTTGEAVMRQNVEDGQRRVFICVQKNEACRDGSIAKEGGFDCITQISKKRLTLAIKDIKSELEGKGKGDREDLDLGFVVKKLL